MPQTAAESVHEYEYVPVQPAAIADKIVTASSFMKARRTMELRHMTGQPPTSYWSALAS